MPIRHNQTARYRLSILLKGTIDASLAANLPASPVGGDTYQVTVAGDFQSSALINPAGAYFDATNYVSWNAETSKWDKIDTTENISDAAYDATGWDGVTRDAPSKNAIRDKIVAMDASIAVVSGEADNIETAVGLNANGTFIAHSGSTYMDAATTAKGARELLDTALNGHVVASGAMVHGLGTMSTQNANNVAITGGAIDGTTIGATTPAAVTATTLATGVAAATSRLDISGVAVAAAGSDSNINIDLTPKGTGEVNIPKVDIDGGTIDGATIATSNITVGSGKTLDVSAGTLTLAADQISGDKVEGGTIAAITITALTTTTAAAGTSDTKAATNAYVESEAIKFAIVLG